MKLTRSATVSLTPFYVAPLINVVLLLLFFFLLGSSFTLQPGIVVNVPFSPFKLGPQINPHIVSITAGPMPSVYFDDRKIRVEDLGKRLARTRGADRPVIIKADRSTPYELVVAVSNEALRLGFSVVLATSLEEK